MLELLGRLSSINVRKVLWTCLELGFEPSLTEWGSGSRSLQAPEFLALNPNGLVPVVKDGGFVLWESNAICRYLAHKHRRFDLLPEGPAERAIVEQWMDWQLTEINNAWRYAFMGLVRHSPKHRDASAIADSVTQWNHQMAILDRTLGRTGAFVTGEAFTLADIVVGLSTHRWYATPITRPQLTAVAAYYARLRERPAFARYSDQA
ncbi:MAG: glutathione S-transferase [Alphaproteobacteria bacterium]|nr:glutathione S-transferase [Alphaproteobacteria bacterium]